jgi:hypothetical protein
VIQNLSSFVFAGNFFNLAISMYFHLYGLSLRVVMNQERRAPAS